MKKSLFLFATAALVLAACSSEDDIVQSAPQKAEAQNNAVMFDTYTSSATRAGNPVGVMNTDKLKTENKGFGVFAMFQENADYSPGSYAPTFMFNEHIHWTNGWTYSPLKYWPNETDKDSQGPDAATSATATTCDKLSFFAYAPYVDLSSGTGSMETNRSSSSPVDAYNGGAGTAGIMSYSKEDRTGDPLVEWKYSTDLDNNVDLLWGVAPAGLSYTAVNGTTIGTTFGKPVLNMVKPDKDQRIKFLFQHALSRLGLTVVSAIDQVSAGDDGDVFKPAESRVLINSVKLYGEFGIQGVLNLNNSSANVANWIATSIDQKTTSNLVFTIDNANKNLNPVLEEVAAQLTAVGSDVNNFAFMNAGVLPSETPLLSNGVDLSKKVASATPAYAYGTVLYKDNGAGAYVVATVASETAALYVKDASGNYQQKCISTGNVNLDGTTKYYKITATAQNASSAPLAVDDVYYTRSGAADGSYVYTKHVATEAITTSFDYYAISGETEAAASGNYASGTYYYEAPRYFMVIPTGASDIKVVIDYDVITKDAKLTNNVSKVNNVITKTINLNLESGKAYNLKLILGLTSVKLDASVGVWQVADDAEVYLPQNND